MARPRTVDDKAVIERYLADEEVAAIAASYGVDQKTVYNVLKRNGVAKKQGRLSETQKLDIAARYAKGTSAADIAAALGVSKRTVYNTIGKSDTGTKRTMGSLSAEQEDLIIARYAAGEPVLQISRDFTNVHLQTIHNMLKRRGVVDPARAKPRVGAARESQILDAVRGGSNVPAAMTAFGVSEGTVTRLLRKTRAEGELVNLPQGRPRVYALDETAFDKLTPECLYWLGFIFADGCVYYPKDGSSPSLIVVLGVVDRDHLEKLRAFVKTDRPIRHIEKTKTSLGGPFARFSIRSKRLCDIVRERGIVTKRTRFPPPELAESRDFWRGAVDGDGNFGIGLFGKYLYPHIGLAGQIPLLETFRTFLQANKLPSLNPHRSKNSNVPSISTSGSTAKGIIDLLYRDAVVALDRKSDRAKRIIAGDIEKSAPYTEGPSTVYVDETDAPDDDNVD
jgi:transposase